MAVEKNRKEDWVGAYGHQYETEEEYKRALGYYVCMYCGSDLPEPLPSPQFCSSCMSSEHVRRKYGISD